MKPTQFKRHRCNGFALILSMIFLLVFSALAVAMFSASSTNVQIASNHHKANMAFANAESGLEVMRFWLNHIKMPASTPVDHYYATILHDLRVDLIANGVYGLYPHYNGSISSVDIQSGEAGTFSAQLKIDPSNPTILQVYVTGSYAGINKTLRVDYNIVAYEYPIFNFGLATRGPLQFGGNPTLVAANEGWEADVFVESLSNSIAVAINGNTNFDGNINISNPVGTADFNGDVQIAGDHDQAAIDNHVFSGVDPVEFPIPVTDGFRAYATGNIIDAGTDTSDNMTLVNVTIQAGANPTFEGNVIIQGIFFVEQPNQVIFKGNVDLRGTIVADGDIENPGTNKMDFLGNFATNPLPAGPQFDAMRDEVGSSIIAPGFAATLSGNFASLSGVMAVSGFHLAGNCSALVEGTMINYSDAPTVVEGNPTITFDRSNSPTVPAGFDTHRILDYTPASYSVVH